VRIEKIDIVGYQGIQFLSLDIEHPVVLIGGKNGTGKTTIRDAIRFAMTSESGRVKHKKDYNQLVRIGTDPKDAQVGVVVDGFTFGRKVASGKAAHEEVDYPIVLPHLLGSSRFALLPHKEQAALLFRVTGVKRDQATIKAMLEERGIAPECIEQAMPMLRAGFASASKSCKDEQSMCRGAWEATTDERFGEAKAVNWKAVAGDVAPLPIDELKQARQELAARKPEIEKEIAELDQKREEWIQHTHSGGAKYQCPECEAALIIMMGKLVVDERNDEPEPPIDEQQDVAKRLAKLREEQATIAQQIGECDAQIAAFENAERVAEERTQKAAGYFEKYQQWKKAAEALAPTGIPLQLLEAGLAPINERLAQTTKLAQWKPIVIASDLSITYGGISYPLCSESEQWRVDAAIAEALALLSNVKLFVLDRLDVLHPDDRPATLMWLLEVSKSHDSIFVMATLKEEPKGLPAGIQSVWLDAGSKLKEAA
jgi:energy-coupling factor transporter ATP-binding protein EcfA2